MSYPVDRRRFVLSLIAAKMTSSASLLASPLHQPSATLLIGTHDGQGIYRASWDVHTGRIGAAELAATTPQPTYLARHPHAAVVYACNETDAPAAAISAFALDTSTGTLKPLGSQPTGGSAPCFVTVDRTGRLLFSANYGGGSLSTFRLDLQGDLSSAAAAVFQCSAANGCGTLGPVKDRQEAPHLHCAVLSPDNRFLLACDLGDDSILVFPIQPHDAEPLGHPTRVAAKAGSGPRHLAFHPNGRWLYCIHELDCTVGLLHWRPERPGKAAYAPDSLVTVLPSGQSAEPQSTGAEVAVTRDGRFVYTSTRAADVLTLFAINASDGKLQQLQQLPCGGKTPRFFALDPTERWLLCANQNSDTVTVFARDMATGTLALKGTYPAPNPECLLWV